MSGCSNKTLFTKKAVGRVGSEALLCKLLPIVNKRMIAGSQITFNLDKRETKYKETSK